MAAQRPSSLVGITRATLTLAATLGLARVFVSPSWFAPVAIAAVIPAGVVAFSHRRRWPGWLTVVLVVLAGWWFAMLVNDPSTTVVGVPSLTTFSTFFHDLAHAPHELRNAIVPVDVRGPALLLAVVATFIAAALTEWIAGQLAAPVGAIGPSIALYISIAALGEGRWVPTTAIYAFAVLGYLLALQNSELTERRAWFHAPKHRTSQLVAGGAVAGVVAVLVAVTLGPSVPGASGDPLLNYRKLGAGSQGSLLTAAPPILGLRDKLSEPSSAEVFTVTTDDEAGWYWRVIALDHLSDETWTVPPTDARSAKNLPTPPHDAITTKSVQRFDLEDLDAYWLPAAYRPTSISLSGAQVVPNSLTLYLPRGQLSDIKYTVQSQVPRPTAAQLDATTWRGIRTDAQLTALPDNFPSRVRQLAAQITKGAATPYAAADALEKFFGPENGFVYTLDTNLHSSGSALEKFLFDTKAGFCEQYASAFAAMARSVGLPTRVAVGYQTGTLMGDGAFHVTNHDAHAWPEVWLGDTIGWYAFEPTPGRQNPANHQGSGGGSSTTPTTSVTPTTTGATTPNSSTANTLPKRTPDQLQVNGGSAAAPKRHDTVHRVFLALLIIAGLALATALVVLVVAVVRTWLRTRRRRRAADPRGRVLGARAEALERMDAAGIEPRPSATPVEFALRHAPAHGAGAAGPPLMELAALQTNAMFAPDPPTDQDATTAWEHVEVIDRAVRSSTPRFQRWSRRLRAGREKTPTPV